MGQPEGNETPEQRLAAARSWAARGPARVEPEAGGAAGEVTDRLHTVIEAAERAAEAIRYDAEEQARRHLAEAQQKADRLTAERVKVISRLTDDLIEHASVVKEHSERMVGALERAIETVGGRLEEVDAAESVRTGIGAGAAITRPAAAGGPVTFTYREKPRPEEAPRRGAEESSAPEPPPAEPASPAPATTEPEPSPGTEAAGAEGGGRPAVAEAPSAALLRATQLAVAGGDRGSIGQALREEFGIDPGPVLDQVLG